jgi:hypothetical protein
MKLEFPRQIFEKYSNIKLNENRLVGAELLCPFGGTDRQTILRTRLKRTKFEKLDILPFLKERELRQLPCCFEQEEYIFYMIGLAFHMMKKTRLFPTTLFSLSWYIFV